MALNNKEEGRNQFRLQYCPQPWRFLNLLSLKEELVSRGLHTGGARKALELRIAQYEERVKRMGGEDSVEAEKPPSLTKGTLMSEFKISSCLRHVTLKPFREEMLDISGVLAWLAEASGYILKKTKAGSSVAILKFETIEKGDAAYFDLKDKLQGRGVSVSHSEFSSIRYSRKCSNTGDDPIQELLGEDMDTKPDDFFSRVILLENMPSDLCLDEKLAGVFPEAQSTVNFDHLKHSKGIVALDMGSEGAVKTLLGNEETVQIEIEGSKVYASRCDIRIKVWKDALKMNKKIFNRMGGKSESQNETEEWEDLDYFAHEDVFEDSKNVILSDNKRLEMSRKLREVDRILAGLSNTTEIFGFEKTEMYRKLNKDAQLLYIHLVEDAKRRLSIGEALPEPLELIPEPMQNHLGYNNAPFRQLDEIEQKYKKANAQIDEAKLTMENLWKQVVKHEKLVRGAELAEYQRRKNLIQRYDEKGKASKADKSKSKQTAKTGAEEESEEPEEMQRDNGGRKMEVYDYNHDVGKNQRGGNDGKYMEEDRRVDYSHAGGPQRGKGNKKEQSNRKTGSDKDQGAGMPDGNDWGKFMEQMFGKDQRTNTGVKTAPNTQGKRNAAITVADFQPKKQRVDERKHAASRVKDEGKKGSGQERTKDSSSSDSKFKGKGTALVPYDLDDSGDEDKKSESKRNRSPSRRRSDRRRSRSRSISRGRRRRSRSRSRGSRTDRNRRPVFLDRRTWSRPKHTDGREEKDEKRPQRQERWTKKPEDKRIKGTEKEADMLISKAINTNDWLNNNPKTSSTTTAVQEGKKQAPAQVDYVVAQKTVLKQPQTGSAGLGLPTSTPQNLEPLATKQGLTVTAQNVQNPGMVPVAQVIRPPVMTAAQSIQGMVAVGQMNRLPVMTATQQMPGMVAVAQINRLPVMTATQQMPGQFMAPQIGHPLIRQSQPLQAPLVPKQLQTGGEGVGLPTSAPQNLGMMAVSQNNRFPVMSAAQQMPGQLITGSHIASLQGGISQQIPAQMPGQLTTQIPSQVKPETAPAVPGQMFPPGRSELEKPSQMPAQPSVPSSAALKLSAIEAVLNEKMRRLQELQKGSLSLMASQDKSANNQEITPTLAAPSNTPGSMPVLPDRAAGLGFQGLPENSGSYM